MGEKTGNVKHIAHLLQQDQHPGLELSQRGATNKEIPLFAKNAAAFTFSTLREDRRGGGSPDGKTGPPLSMANDWALGCGGKTGNLGLNQDRNRQSPKQGQDGSRMDGVEEHSPHGDPPVHPLKMPLVMVQHPPAT